MNDLEIKKLSHLAKIAVSDDELSLYIQGLSRILNFIAQIQQVDTHNVVPLSHPLEGIQRTWPDVVLESDQRKIAKSLAPQVKEDLYVVPKVIE